MKGLMLLFILHSVINASSSSNLQSDIKDVEHIIHPQPETENVDQQTLTEMKAEQPSANYGAKTEAGLASPKADKDSGAEAHQTETKSDSQTESNPSIEAEIQNQSKAESQVENKADNTDNKTETITEVQTHEKTETQQRKIENGAQNVTENEVQPIHNYEMNSDLKIFITYVKRSLKAENEDMSKNSLFLVEDLVDLMETDLNKAVKELKVLQKMKAIEMQAKYRFDSVHEADVIQTLAKYLHQVNYFQSDVYRNHFKNRL